MGLSIQLLPILTGLLALLFANVEQLFFDSWKYFSRFGMQLCFGDFQRSFASGDFARLHIDLIVLAQIGYTLFL